jgi:carbonic anhydrase
MSEIINIDKQLVKGNCDFKCMYNFDYTETNCNASNNGFSIVIKPQETNDYPVVYNSEKYRVSSILLMYPSSILYNGKRADAELTIVHLNQSGKMMRVLIPIKISTESTNATDLLENVIRDVAESAPSEGETVNIGYFDLLKIVPTKPFFSCNTSDSKCVCFEMLDAIPLSQTKFDTLGEIIKPNNNSLFIKGSLFYNPAGPNTTSLGENGIYISCNPTGSSEETEEVVYDKQPTKNDFLDNKIFIVIFQLVVACSAIFLVCFIWNYFFNFINGDVDLSKIKSFKFNLN